MSPAVPLAIPHGAARRSVRRVTHHPANDTARTPRAMSPAVPLAATRAAPRVESRFLPPAVSHMA